MVEGKNPTVGQKNKLIVIAGPTASGKTRRAVSISRILDGEIISADSRQVYRDMNIGTGKDLEEYGEVPYHLIDICNAGEKYNLHRFLADFNSAVNDIRARGKRIVVCGGTGMYLENAIGGIKTPEVPENRALRERLSNKSLEELTKILQEYKSLHNTTDVDTTKRAIRAVEIAEYYRSHPEEAMLADKTEASPFDSVIIGIDLPRDIRRQRITERLDRRLQEGMIAEVENLLTSGIAPEDLIYYGLEYKYLTLYVTGVISYEEMVTQLETAIHQFAKRQMTWFRGMERRGFKIHWLSHDLPENDFNERVLALL